MKAAKYAFSVQWGSGHHYFLRTDDDIEKVSHWATSQAEMLRRRQGKRGAKPTVHVWKKLSETEIR